MKSTTKKSKASTVKIILEEPKINSEELAILELCKELEKVRTSLNKTLSLHSDYVHSLMTNYKKQD